jgi:hypothetical protein
MADLHTASDSSVQTKATDHQSAVGIESSAQAMSKPGESANSGSQVNAEKTDKLVNTGVLPDMLILDDADRPAGGKNSMKSKDVEKAAEEVVNVIKTADPATRATSVADAMNNAVKNGANLTELVEDINKDMADSRFPNMQHAKFSTDTNGQESITVKTGPFGGQQFKVNNDVVTPGFGIR